MAGNVKYEKFKGSVNELVVQSSPLAPVHRNFTESDPRFIGRTNAQRPTKPEYSNKTVLSLSFEKANNALFTEGEIWDLRDAVSKRFEDAGINVGIPTFDHHKEIGRAAGYYLSIDVESPKDQIEAFKRVAEQIIKDGKANRLMPSRSPISYDGHKHNTAVPPPVQRPAGGPPVLE